MHIFIRYLAVVTLISLFSACKSGEKLYNKGRYGDAVVAFVKKLQKKPQDATSLQLLPKAYAAALDYHEDRVRRQLASNDELKWETVRLDYRAMQVLYDMIRASPAASAVVKPKDYSSAIAGAQENAAEIRYQRGIELLQNGEKAAARDAYQEFGAALQLVPNYKDARERMDEAYQHGVINVMVSEIDVRSPYFQFSADQFRDALVRNLELRNINPFVRFYDARLVRYDSRFHPDQYMQMQFYDFIVGQTYVKRTEREVSKEISVPVEGKKDSTVKITVKAKLFITRKTVDSRGILDYRISELNGDQPVILRQDRIPGSYTWVHQYGTFRGDERALSEEDKRLIGGRDIPVPPPQELFLQLTKPIYDRLTNDLQAFYNQY